MAHAAGDAHEFVIYGAHYRVTFPIFDADGDLVTGATGLDSEASQDGGTFADCTNEATELATSSGMYYLDLIGTETDCKQLSVIVKTTSSGAKTTPIVLYPNRLPILESGVAEGGAASTITFAVASASAKDDFYNGCYVFISDNDAAGSQYQARKIVDYVGSTRVATIDSAWGTNPSSSSNYDVLVPPGMAVVQWGGGKIADPTMAGVPEVDVTHWIGTAAATPTTAGVPEVDVTFWLGTAAATPTVAGVPEVDVTHWIGTAAATPTVAGVPEVDVTHLVGVAQSATDLKDFADDGYDPSTNKVQGVVLVDTVTALAANSIADATLSTDLDIYTAKVWLFDDDAGTTDRYVVNWFTNGVPVAAAAVTSPTIRVYLAASGADLIATVAMTEIGTEEDFRYDATGAERIAAGAGYIAKVVATIGGSSRTWKQPVGRDSA